MRATGGRSRSRKPDWLTHPASLAVTTEFLIASGRAHPSWCGGASPTSQIARRRVRRAAEVPAG